ncbi:hypothetical protein ACPESN_20970 [Stutzerimonas marianensis]|uniref:hypothetical protein n=1 Tax=Stutzerimonas marianensis TaxID=2929513 RepID=UPI003C2AC641
MTVRAWLFRLALPLLAACDGDQPSEQPHAPDTPEPRGEITLGEPIAPEPDQAPRLDQPDQDLPPPISIELPEVTDEAAEAPPPVEVAPAPVKAPERAAAQRRQAADEPVLDAPELDLSLPDDWTETLDTRQEEASLDLLPPLFPTGKPDRSLQMSGRLLPDIEGREDDISGAQINFEIKR